MLFNITATKFKKGDCNMGYSCSTRASFTYDAVKYFDDFDISSESYRFFTEIGRENRDGSITGTVYELNGESWRDALGNTRRACKKLGSFKIASDGSIVRFPGLSSRLFGVAEIASIERYDREFAHV
jgi:hypothetical protein